MKTLISALALVLTATALQSATIAFSDDFSGDTPGTAPSNFTVNPSDAGTATGTRSGSVLVQQVGADKVVRHTLSANKTGGSGGFARIYSQAVQFTNSPGTTGADFFATTQFTLNSFAGNSNSDTVTFSLIALATGNTWGTNDDARYQLNYNLVGSTIDNSPRLWLQESSGSGLDPLATSTGTLAPVAGTTYTLSLTGTYSIPGSPTSQLSLEGSLTDGTNTLTVSFDDPTPRIGSYFGLRSGVNEVTTGQTTSAQIDVTNFSVVPEPSIALLAVLGALVLLCRRL